MRLLTTILACLILWASPAFAQPPPVPPGLNPGDHYHIAFVTLFTTGIVSDTSVPPPFYPDFGGVAAADYIIEDTAAALGYVPGWNFSDVTWKAILSTSTVDARDHINVQGPVYNTRGELVATGAADLWDGSIAHAIQYDEGGGDIFSDFRVWTGTNSLGTRTGNTAGSNWNDPIKSAGYGSLGATDGTWVQASVTSAANVSRLYGISPLLTAPVPGDYDNDGVADAGDYIAWRRGTFLADGNRNNLIDQGDYDIWRAHFGETLPGSGSSIESSSVPEPSSLALLLVLGATLLLV